jgi:nucleoside phosphorylase
MTFDILDITIYNKEKTIAKNAKISLAKNGDLLIMDSDGNKILWSAVRARVEEMAAAGIFLSCYVSTGVTKQGVQKYEHRDIFCRY